MTDKCLVIEARKKCQCDWCKKMREFQNLSYNAEVSYLAQQILIESLREAGIK